MSDLVRVQVLMSKAEANRFDSYCRERGYKKSPLIARLVRDYLDNQILDPQPNLFDQDRQESNAP